MSSSAPFRRMYEDEGACECGTDQRCGGPRRRVGAVVRRETVLAHNAPVKRTYHNVPHNDVGVVGPGDKGGAAVDEADHCDGRAVPTARNQDGKPKDGGE